MEKYNIIFNIHTLLREPEMDLEKVETRDEHAVQESIQIQH